MLKKSLGIISVLTLATACSHGPAHKAAPVSQLAHTSWLKIIKGSQPGKPQSDKRHPASKKNKKNVPGFAEFIRALKSNPSFFAAPVGYQVVKQSTMTSDGQNYTSEDSSIYLSQNTNGHFVLEKSKEQSEAELVLHENERPEFVESDMEGTDFTEFRKLSDTKFIAVFSFSLQHKGNCEMTLDLEKSSELIEHKCVYEDGKIQSETKVLSVKSVDVKSYSDVLKEKKLEVYPIALDCNEPTDDEVDSCNGSVKDAEPKNWSYIVK